jgi:ribosomal protein L14E/L6E/L27E
MKEWKSEMLAVSRAGHDKDTLYVVLESDETYVWLADGKRRCLETPKKKKHKHVQIIKHLPQELIGQMQCITSDAHVRKILAAYGRNADNNQ